VRRECCDEVTIVGRLWEAIRKRYHRLMELFRWQFHTARWQEYCPRNAIARTQGAVAHCRGVLLSPVPQRGCSAGKQGPRDWGLRSSKALARKRVSSIGGSPPMLASKHFGMLPEFAGHAHPHHVDLVAETKSTVVWRYSRGVPQVIMEVFDPPNPVVVQRDLNATAGDPTRPNS
jgi:hypothetical protein